ncbi:MAG: TraR/DksA family transcriptional regulator [Bryobacterales bacterium]|nr:TraR/DksA family transcriptional regulator [Bryobacterales bacterium]
MTSSQMKDYRHTLKALRTELINSLPGRDGIFIEQTSDALDQTQSAADRDLAVETLNRHSARLREIDAALARIKDGTYGICLHCEEEIGPRRLKAVPYTGYCIACQQRRDARGMALAGQHWFDPDEDYPAAA